MKKRIFYLGLLLQIKAACFAQLPLIQTEGTYFINAANKEKIVLKGLSISNNCWGFYEWPKSDSLEKVGMDIMIRQTELKDFVFNETDVENIDQLKGNVVRYSFNYELFALNNPKRKNNINVLKNHINLLEKKGIYTIVHLHMGPGLDVQNDNYEREKPASKRMKSVFENDSTFRLWKNMWQSLAAELKDINAVAGYEIIDEPRKPAHADATENALLKKYVEVIDSIRAMDNKHIIMVCEFNSREANPGEIYWSNKQQQNIADQGEQGVIWERSWLQLPKNISNLVYVAHLYDPYKFTLGKTSDTYKEQQIIETINKITNWAYKINNNPLYVSEYGVNYIHTLNNQTNKRIEYLKILHDELEKHHISSTFWQYKDLITPWVDMGGTLGLWMQFYDISTIDEIKNNKVAYTREDAKEAAGHYNVDQVLNVHFIKDGKFQTFSKVGNQPVIDELKRYFSNEPLHLKNELK